jgi:hypothetical protein
MTVSTPASSSQSICSLARCEAQAPISFGNLRRQSLTEHRENTGAKYHSTKTAIFVTFHRHVLAAVAPVSTRQRRDETRDFRLPRPESASQASVPYLHIVVLQLQCFSAISNYGFMSLQGNTTRSSIAEVYSPVVCDDDSTQICRQ